jgi:hypothetical protein
MARLTKLLMERCHNKRSECVENITVLDSGQIDNPLLQDEEAIIEVLAFPQEKINRAFPQPAVNIMHG